MAAASLRHFLDLMPMPVTEVKAILAMARAIKAKRHAIWQQAPLRHKTLALVFERPSTRTRVSFDRGMRELGGDVMMLTGAEMQLGRGETLGDTARVLSRYVDAMMVRMLDHAGLLELAEHATIPVINGLTKRSHPCQIMADLLTFEEHRGPISGQTVAWVGDGNNVLMSWMEATIPFEFTLRVASPKALALPDDMVAAIKAKGGRIECIDDPREAVRGVMAVITDCWVSMGDKDAERRHQLLSPYQVNGTLMKEAHKDAIFMHCLPAHRGEEVTADIMDGPQSVVFDEAENRLHAQKGVLAWAFGLEGI